MARFRKNLMAEYNQKMKEHKEMHRSVKMRMAEREAVSSELNNLYLKKTSSLTRLRNK